MEELLNKGIHIAMENYTCKGVFDIFGIKVRTNVSWSGTIDVDGIGDVVDVVQQGLAQETLDNLVKSCIKDVSNDEEHNFYNIRFKKRS